MGKHKKMCELKKSDIKKKRKKFSELVREPEFYCEKCMRVCISPDRLCSPEKLPSD